MQQPTNFFSSGKQPAGTTCVDANECAIDGACDQICQNTPGSFMCSCVPGYQLIHPTSCIAMNVPTTEPPTLIFANSIDVQHTHLNGTFINKISTHETLAIDFDHRNRTICWVAHNQSNKTVKIRSNLKCVNIDTMADPWNLPQPDLFRQDVK